MKEFNLEQAKAGKPVCTRNSCPAHILKFDGRGNYPLIGYYEEHSVDVCDCWSIDGRFHNEGDKHLLDLMMVEEKKEGWVNILWDADTQQKIMDVKIFNSKEEAEKKKYSCFDIVGTIKIEWEE